MVGGSQAERGPSVPVVSPSQQEVAYKTLHMCFDQDANYARELLDSIVVRDEEETGARCVALLSFSACVPTSDVVRLTRSTSTAFSTYEAKLNKITMSLILAQPVCSICFCSLAAELTARLTSLCPLPRRRHPLFPPSQST